MNCRELFDREFLVNHMSVSWVTNKLRPWRERVMLDQQMSMIPHSMDYIERLKKKDDLDEQMHKIDEAVDQLSLQLRRQVRLYDHQKTALARELHRIEHELDYIGDQALPDDLKFNIRRPLSMDLGAAEAITDSSDSSESSGVSHHFYGRCSVTDCDGFVSRSWTCLKCSAKTCAKCHTHIPDSTDNDNNTPHECDTGAVESVKLIKNSTRNCPSCFIAIHRIDGCDQVQSC